MCQPLMHIFRTPGLAARCLKVSAEPSSCLGSGSPLFSGLQLLGSDFDSIFNADADCNLFFFFFLLSPQQLKEPDAISRDK